MGDAPEAYGLGPGEGEARWGADGALTTIKASGEPKGRPDRRHRGSCAQGRRDTSVHAADDETFYVLEGELIFRLGDAAPVTGRAGSFVHVPGGVAHAFRVEAETARYLIFTRSRHGESYRAISEPAPERVLPPPSPMDMEKIEAACERYGVET